MLKSGGPKDKDCKLSSAGNFINIVGSGPEYLKL